MKLVKGICYGCICGALILSGCQGNISEDVKKEQVQASKATDIEVEQVAEVEEDEVKETKIVDPIDEQAVKDCFAEKVTEFRKASHLCFSAFSADFDDDQQLEMLVIYQELEGSFKIQIYEYGETGAIMASEKENYLGSNADGGKKYSVVRNADNHYYLQQLCDGDGWEYVEYTQYRNGVLSEKAYYHKENCFNRDTLVKEGEPLLTYRVNEKETSQSEFLEFTQMLDEENNIAGCYALDTILEDYTEMGKDILEDACLYEYIESTNMQDIDELLCKNEQGEVILEDEQIRAILFYGLSERILNGELGPVTKGEYGENKVEGYNFTLYQEASGEVKAFSVEKGCEILGLHLTETPEEVRQVLLQQPDDEGMIEETGCYTQRFKRGKYDLVVEYDENKTMIRILVKEKDLIY